MISSNNSHWLTHEILIDSDWSTARIQNADFGDGIIRFTDEINVGSRDWPMLQKVTEDNCLIFWGKIDKFITDCKSVTHEAVVTALAKRVGLPGQ